MKVKLWHVPLGLCFAVTVTGFLATGAPSAAAEAEAEDLDYGELAAAYVELGEYEEALKWYERGLALEPDDAFLLLGKAAALIGMGRPAEALESLDRALALEPGYALIYKAKIALLKDAGRLQEVVEACDETIARGFGDKDVYRYKAESLMELGRYEVATRTLTRAAEMGFEDADSFIERWDEFVDYGDYETGALYAGAALALSPNDVAVLISNGWALTFVEKYDDALECADRALALGAGNDAWILKGMILLYVGEAATALQCFNPVSDAGAEQTGVCQLRGAAYLMQDKYDQARAAFEESLALGSGEHVFLFLYLVDRAEGREGEKRLGPLLKSQHDPLGREIARFLAGETGADDLLMQARYDAFSRCEAHFYIGCKSKFDGDAAAARRHFEKAVATEARRHLVYILSKQELRRSDAAGE